MQKKMKVIILVIAFLLCKNSLPGQSTKEKIDSLMHQMHQSNQFDGAILVAGKQGVLYKKGFGQADAENNINNRYNTLFYIASLTKPFTALRIMQLVQSGKIDTNSTLSAYFPGLKNEAIRKITIHQLLSHSSGIPDFIDASVQSEKKYTDQWFIEKLDSITLDVTGETKFRYANTAYVLLAHIIEKVTGLSYAENLEKNIFAKCEMHQSGNLTTGQNPENMAKGYIKNDSTITSASFLNPAIFKGAGSIYSTVEDLYRFDRALHSGSLIQEHYKDMLLTRQAGPYGYGWFISSSPFGKIIFHGGGLPGYTSLMLRVVEKNYFIVILSNNQSIDPYKQAIAKQIIEILHQDGR